MKLKSFLCVFVNFCALMITLTDLKPVPESEAYPRDCVHSKQKLRAVRSIPGQDDANPAYNPSVPELQERSLEGPSIQQGQSNLQSPSDLQGRSSAEGPSNPQSPSNLQGPSNLQDQSILQGPSKLQGPTNLKGLSKDQPKLQGPLKVEGPSHLQDFLDKGSTASSIVEIPLKQQSGPRFWNPLKQQDQWNVEATSSLEGLLNPEPLNALPAASNVESPSNQQTPLPLDGPLDAGKENDIQLFAPGDKTKNKEDQQLPLMKQGSLDSAANLVSDNGLVPGDGLLSDDQLECYEQQNIEPPNEGFDRPRPILKLKDQRLFANFPENGQKRLSRPALYKEGKSKRLKGKGNDDDVITSLYSDSEIRHKNKNDGVMLKQPKENSVPEELHQASVYKPVGVRPEFPVYDEDIDFHPDPLQGILEDKYWLDPQEQEAVIRKYIDLANNMQPPRHDHAKRDVPGGHEPKSVDSKDVFREAEAVESERASGESAVCKDCNKGKKSNFSETKVDESSYNTYENRKLMSFSYGDGEGRDGDPAFDGEDVLSKLDDDGYNFQDLNNDIQKAATLEDNANRNESNIINYDTPSFTSNYFGRKLLSFENEENADNVYDEDEDSLDTDYVTSKMVFSPVQSPDNILYFTSESSDKYGNLAHNMHNRRAANFDTDIDEENTQNKTYYNSPIILNPSNSSVFEYKFETEKIGDENKDGILNSTEEFFYLQKPFIDNTHNMAKYYVPDKIGNFFKKVMNPKNKPKERSTTIDPDAEFELERNQTFTNVSIAVKDINISVTVTTPTPGVGKNHKRREQPTFLEAKGRRSYQLPLLKKQNVKNLQDADGTGSLTVNASSSTNNSLPVATNADNTTLLNVNNTTTTDSPSTFNTTETDTSDLSTPKGKTKKPKEEYDEDSFDAEIANDIVETVIAESESGSVMGHNLGLCRRNDTVSKYARVSPESEQLLKKVTQCILDRIRDRLEGQSCTLLDNELLQFLKWMVLSGESYKDYLARLRPELKDFKTMIHEEGAGPPVKPVQGLVPPVTVSSHAS